MDGTRGVTVQARDGEGACPYCRAGFAPGERALVCEGCQAPYHEECMRHELGRCATLGCGGRRALPRAVGGAAEAPPRPVEPRRPTATDRSRCAGCQEALRVDEPVLVCASCRAEYHPPCAERTARCLHAGCTSQDARRRAHGDPRDRLVLAAFVGAVVFALVTGVLLLTSIFGEGADLDVAVVVAPGLASVVLGLAGWCGRAFDRPGRFGAPSPPSPSAPPSTPPTCATCWRLLVRGEPLLECDGCAGQHHPGCLRQARRCRVAGCAGTRAVPRRAR